MKDKKIKELIEKTLKTPPKRTIIGEIIGKEVQISTCGTDVGIVTTCTDQRLNDVLLSTFKQFDDEDEEIDERFYEFIDEETLNEFLNLMSS